MYNCIPYICNSPHWSFSVSTVLQTLFPASSAVAARTTCSLVSEDSYFSHTSVCPQQAQGAQRGQRKCSHGFLGSWSCFLFGPWAASHRQPELSSGMDRTASACWSSPALLLLTDRTRLDRARGWWEQARCFLESVTRGTTSERGHRLHIPIRQWADCSEPERCSGTALPARLCCKYRHVLRLW